MNGEGTNGPNTTHSANGTPRSRSVATAYARGLVTISRTEYFASALPEISSAAGVVKAPHVVRPSPSTPSSLTPHSAKASTTTLAKSMGVAARRAHARSTERASPSGIPEIMSTPRLLDRINQGMFAIAASRTAPGPSTRKAPENR